MTNATNQTAIGSRISVISTLASTESILSFMIQLGWILIILVVVLNTISIKVSTETETEGSRSELSSTEEVDSQDILEIFELNQSQIPELEKKRKDASKPETEKKKGFESEKGLEDVEEENLDDHINTDKKYGYSQVQAVIREFNKFISRLYRYVRPYMRYVYDEPIQHQKSELEKKIEEAFELEAKKKKDLEEVRQKKQSTIDKLIENNALLKPKLVAEQLYKVLKPCSIIENEFNQVPSFFENGKCIIKKFCILMTRDTAKPRETHKEYLQRCWTNYYKYIPSYLLKPTSPFKFVIHILTWAVMRSSELGIPIVECVQALEIYMEQIEDVYWHLYASKITDFDTHYRSTPEQIAQRIIKFIESRPNKEKAIAMVKEFVCVRPSACIRMAFKDGVMNQETLESLKGSIIMLHNLLWRKYGSDVNNYGIRAIYNVFLFPLIKDLSRIERHGIKVDLVTLLNSIELRLQSIWNIISTKLKSI